MPTDRAAGQEWRLAGRYRLGRVLGSGGGGIVREGEDTLLRRRVAVKEVRLPLHASQAERDLIGERVLREARAAARLRHPGLVTVYDVLEADDHPWIVMEYVDGVSLAEVIRESGRLSPLRVARIGIILAYAIEAAHRAGVVHRDVKPGNVLITSDEHAQLTDFGIAVTEGDTTLTGTGMLVGSPAYIPPERARGAKAAPAGDVWGLGATLFTAVEGVSPYPGEGTLAILAAVVENRRRPCQHAGALAAVLDDLLESDPARRPSLSQTRVRLRQVVQHLERIAAETARREAAAAVAAALAADAAAAAAVAAAAAAAAEAEAAEAAAADAVAAVAVAAAAAATAEADPPDAPAAPPAADVVPPSGGKEAADSAPAPAPASDSVPPAGPRETPAGRAASAASAEPDADAGEEPDKANGAARSQPAKTVVAAARPGVGVRRPRAGVLATAAVAVAVAVAVTVGLVLTGGSPSDASDAGPATMSSANSTLAPTSPPASSSTAGSPPAAVAPSTPATEPPAAETTPTQGSSELAPTSDGDLGALVPSTTEPAIPPPGFTSYQDDSGWSAAVPADWGSRSPRASQVTFAPASGNPNLLIEVRDVAGPSAIDAWFELEASLETGEPDYRRVSVRAADGGDGSEAAIWEWTFTSNGQTVHALNFGVVRNGHGYALRWRAPEAEFADSLPLMRTIIESFRPGP